VGSLSRRQFVGGATSLGLLVGCGRWPWQAEAPAKVPRIGVLSQATADLSDVDNAAFRQGLRDLGYAEGQNITLEWRSAGSLDQLPQLAAELVGRSVDLIVAQGNVASQEAKRASATIPVVMAFSPDPVRAGLVASLGRPGGNVTGLATLTGQLSAKRLELLRDTIPGAAHVAMLWAPEIADRAYEFEETAAAAQVLGLGLQSVELRRDVDLQSALEGILQARVEALLVQSSLVTNRYRPEVGEFAITNRLPTMFARRAFVEAGGLMAYGPDFPGMHRRAAYYVDRILKGAQPADLPVEQPMTFEFVVNMKTARELGVTFPPEIQQQITEVVQ
jgi:putative tryptophan/tyrosine transport system substrate-binding protein